MKISEQLDLIFRTFGFAFIELPLKFLIRSLSICLFAVEAILLFIPCLLIEAVFMTRRTPFHWLVDSVGRLSEKLDCIADLDTGFRIFWFIISSAFSIILFGFRFCVYYLTHETESQGDFSAIFDRYKHKPFHLSSIFSQKVINRIWTKKILK